MTMNVFRLSEAAKILSVAWGRKVPVSTLREWARKGKLEAIETPGGQYLVKRATLEALAGTPLDSLSDKAGDDATASDSHAPTDEGPAETL